MEEVIERLKKMSSNDIILIKNKAYCEIFNEAPKINGSYSVILVGVLIYLYHTDNQRFKNLKVTDIISETSFKSQSVIDAVVQVSHNYSWIKEISEVLNLNANDTQNHDSLGNSR